jgi:pimeloyl-ACP methyl ester carboxylesterase
MKARTGFAEVDGGRLYYEVAGEGPAVVLGHAGIADLRMWDDQVAPFAERYTVVRYDIRGFGRSPAADAPWSAHDDIAALLDHVAIGTAAVVGVSMSGAISVDFAVTHPGRLWALVLVGAALDGFDWGQDAEMTTADAEEVRLLEAGDIDGAVEHEVRIWVDGPRREAGQADAAVRESVAEMQRAIYESGRNPTEHAADLDPRAITRLEEISAPTLVLAGDADFDGIQQIAGILASRIPGAERAVIRNTAHVPNMERPAEFNRLVLDFLARHA